MKTGELLFDPVLASVAAPDRPQRPSPLAPLVVSRYQEVITLLRHKDVETYSPIGAVKSLLGRVGRNPASLIEIMRLSPVVATGEEHRRIRDFARDIIGYLSASWNTEAISRLSRDFLTRVKCQPICDAHHDIAVPLTGEFTDREFDLPARDLQSIRGLSCFISTQAFKVDHRLSDIIHFVNQADSYVHATKSHLMHAKILRNENIFNNDKNITPYEAGLLFGLITAPITLGLSTCLTFSIVTLSRLPQLADTLRLNPDYLSGFVNAFGVGPHLCLGASFSRRVMHTFLTVLLNEFEVYSHAPHRGQ